MFAGCNTNRLALRMVPCQTQRANRAQRVGSVAASAFAEQGAHSVFSDGPSDPVGASSGGATYVVTVQ